MKKCLISILFFVFFLLNASATFGCVCDMSESFAKAFKESTAVFSGKYIGAEYRKGIVNELVELSFYPPQEKKSYEILVLKFQVEKSWKGTAKKEAVLITNEAKFSDGSTSVSDCDLSFEKGKRYLIYAYGKKNELQTNACSRTAALKNAKNDLKRLGAGRRPLA